MNAHIGEPTVKAQIQSATQVLCGLALWTCRRTANLVSFHFGSKERTNTFRGESVVVGQYALHVQCAWRIASAEKIVVGSGDLYHPSDSIGPENPDNFDWTRGPSRCDQLLGLLFKGENRQFMVRVVDVGDAGSLRIMMDKDLSLDVFPNESLVDEYWRLLRPSSEEAHFVLGSEGIHA